jgi:phytoene dehydrogenase-like protein
LPKLPVLDLVIPTLSDASLASPANHFLSIDVRYCPYYLKESNWDDQRDSLGDIVIETLSRFAPNVPDLITHRQVITPLDYERDYALTEGSIYHGQMGLDQLLFMRPVAGSQGARSPIQGLYLCGSGAHPGGGVTGAPGYNAARQVLNSLKAAR